MHIQIPKEKDVKIDVYIFIFSYTITGIFKV